MLKNSYFRISFQVYDLLNTFGVTLSHERIHVIINDMGGEYMKLLLEGLSEGLRLRFIGDNLNFKMSVRFESLSKHDNMEHMFAMAALLSPVYHTDKPNKPQIKLRSKTRNAHSFHEGIGSC